MKVHMCQEPRCHQVIPFEQRYCSEHAKKHYRFANMSHEDRLRAYKEYNAKRRDPVASAFYQSTQWHKVRNYVAARDYHTSAISGLVIPDRQLIVDHIVPRRLCKDPFNTDNLWCLSRGEHTIKTRLEEAIAATPNGDNKLKNISKNWWIKTIKNKISKNRIRKSKIEN